MKRHPLIPTSIIPSVRPSTMDPARVEREFMGLVEDGSRFVISGLAKNESRKLLTPSLRPRNKIQLFDTTFYLSHVKQIPELRFFLAFVTQPFGGGGMRIYPRIFYKDLSLSWRSASHFSRSDDGIWIGKGDVRIERRGDHDYVTSTEATTDLPLEMQTALENLISRANKAGGNEKILDLVLRRSPGDRVEAYRDFIVPRRNAASNKKNLINRGKPVARFKRKNDPTSLTIVRGFEPDFKHGILERSHSKSKLYGGRLRRFRIISVNKKIQYYFIAGPKHVWVFPPQATTTELSSYGVRTVDVVADEDLFIPGYEYHHCEETQNGSELYSQIPAGFVGEACPVDDAKADASPWLDKIPVIQEFRKQVLRK